MALTAADYVSLSEIRDEGITEAMMSDARAERAAKMAARLVDRYCNCWFYEREFSGDDYLYASGRGQAVLHLHAPPLAVTSVEVDYSGANATWDAVDASGYRLSDPELEAKNPKLTRLPSDLPALHDVGARWPAGHRNVRMQGTFGWLEEGATPPAIKDVMLRLVANQREAITADFAAEARAVRGGAIKSKDTHNRSVVFIERLAGGSATGDVFIDSILSQYRRRVL